SRVPVPRAVPDPVPARAGLPPRFRSRSLFDLGSANCLLTLRACSIILVAVSTTARAHLCPEPSAGAISGNRRGHRPARACAHDTRPLQETDAPGGDVVDESSLEDRPARLAAAARSGTRRSTMMARLSIRGTATLALLCAL